MQINPNGIKFEPSLIENPIMINSLAKLKMKNTIAINLRFYLFFLILYICFIPFLSLAQLSVDGKPLMPDLRKFKRESLIIEIPAPDVRELLNQDQLAETEGLPERMGINVPVNISVTNAGAITASKGSTLTWSANIRAKGAIGLGLYFSSFKLTPGSRLFVYSEDKSQILGAFTNLNNQPDGLFAIEVVKGESIIVEYSFPASEKSNDDFTINEVLYVYRPMYFPGDRMLKQGLSGACEVNAACSEGNDWRNEIKSVVRILVKNGNATYWCTGTLVNNTAGDFSPLLLTADHCARSYSGLYATPADVSQWIFYFLYETSGCDNEAVSDNKTLTGAVKLASSSPEVNNGSDFYLVLLNNTVPASYAPFFAGWNRNGELSTSGVGIHHPSGDVKKISTYSQAVTNDQWGQVNGTHFRVIWAETEHGHGVTEGGSSGSPLFDYNGKLIGQLTGGESDCSSLSSPDFYGKLAYSWESNGTHDSTRLQPWLDPMNSGVSSIDGVSYVVNFGSETNAIPVGRSVSFTDFSTISPYQWLWEFEGGEPETSNEKNPSGIKYNKIGKFNVKLTVTNDKGDFSVIKNDYIKVLPFVLFNPESYEYKILLGNNPTGQNHITILNSLGMPVREITDFCPDTEACSIDLSGLQNGIYFVTITSDGYRETAKLMLFRN